MDADLAALQAWFQRQLMATGDAPDWPVAELIAPSRRCTPAERLAVYQNAYVARLLECLQAEFPAVRHAVGDEAFRDLALAHFQRHPPRSYTLGQLGAAFAETLAALRPPRDGHAPDFADFLFQLASYERAVSEVFDAAGPETHPPALDKSLPERGSLPTATPDQWNGCRLEFFACVRPFSADFPVHEYTTSARRWASFRQEAHREERRSEVGPRPDSSRDADRPDKPPVLPAPRPVWLVLHRRDFRVRRWEVPRWQFELLQRLLAGHPVPDALEASGVMAEEADPAAAVFHMFEEWSRQALIRRIVWHGHGS